MFLFFWSRQRQSKGIEVLFQLTTDAVELKRTILYCCHMTREGFDWLLPLVTIVLQNAHRLNLDFFTNFLKIDSPAIGKREKEEKVKIKAIYIYAQSQGPKPKFVQKLL